jgi:hypothetical protein
MKFLSIMGKIAVAGIALQASATPSKAIDPLALDADDDKAILERLDALEKENTELKKRLNRVEKTPARQVAVPTAVPAAATDAGVSSALKGAMGAAVVPDYNSWQGRVPGKVPAQFLRACDNFGEGFWYLPGTEACIKLGGYLRFQGAFNASGDGTVLGADNMAPQGVNTRTNTSGFNYDARAAMSLDLRVPTSLGLVRGYARFGAEQDSPIGSAYMVPLLQPASPNAPFLFWDRGYIQFAGATIGKARSFFDIFAASDGFLTYGNLRTTGDTDLTGVLLAAYTYNWGNGFSTTLSVENPNDHFKVGVIDPMVFPGAFGLGTLVTDNAYMGAATSNQGIGIPDIVGNVRLDGAWGYAGISAALHQVAGGSYTAFPGAALGCSPAGASACKEPSDRLGWAIAGGGDVFVPTGPRDTLGVNVVYSEGAVDYAAKGNRWQLYNGAPGTSAGFAWGVDGIFDNPNSLSSSIQLTQAWSFNGGYEHHWNDLWKTSLYGGYAAINYNQTAINVVNSHLTGAGSICGVPISFNLPPSIPLIIPPGSGNSCSPNYSFWQLGSRTQYSPTAWLDLGIDTTFTRLNTAYNGSTIGLPLNLGQPAGTYTIGNQNVWTVLGRIDLHFLPGQ